MVTKKRDISYSKTPTAILLVYVWMIVIFLEVLANQFFLDKLEERKSLLGSTLMAGDYMFNFFIILGIIIFIFLFLSRVKNSWKYYNYFIAVVFSESIIILIAMILNPEAIIKINGYQLIPEFWAYTLFAITAIISMGIMLSTSYFVTKHKNYFDQKLKKSSKGSSKLAIASYVLGTISLIPFLGIIPGILALIFGISILKGKNEDKEYAKAGIILGIIGFIILIIVIASMTLVNERSDIILESIEDKVVYVKYDVEYLLENVSDSETFSGSGIIYSYENGKLKILTNRHVVDCNYLYDECENIYSEEVLVNINGELIKPSKISFAPKGFDVALLELDISGNFTAIEVAEDTSKGDYVFAVGYPLFADKVVELSKRNGNILEYKELFSDTGFEFEGIVSNAYTSPGSSGGGLFNHKGELIGMNTWASETLSYAIEIKYVKDFEDYVSCENGHFSKDECIEYCNSEIQNSCVL